jgi:membrane protease subunit HflC
MNQRLIIWAAAAVVVFLLLANTFFIVDQRQQVVVTAFGEPVRVINPPGRANYDPGLKAKWFWESLVVLDKRNQAIEPPQETVISSDRVNLVVDAFIRYRIADPLKFYRSLRNETVAEDRLRPLINSSLREVLGSATQNEIVATQRAALMQAILRDMRVRAARSNYGIEVIDVRIKHADLPVPNQEAVFQRMITNMQQQAAQNRGEGEQQKRAIIAEANKEVTITLATANQEANSTKGEGDAKRATIFAASFGKDPSFAAFWRSMQAYRMSLGGEDTSSGQTTMVLSPDSDFFKYFKNGPNAH